MGSQRVGYDFVCVYCTVTSSNFKGKLEKEMATHSSVLAWRIPMDRGAWWAIVHGVAKRRMKAMRLNEGYFL